MTMFQSACMNMVNSLALLFSAHITIAPNHYYGDYYSLCLLCWVCAVYTVSQTQAWWLLFLPYCYTYMYDFLYTLVWVICTILIQLMIKAPNVDVKSADTESADSKPKPADSDTDSLATDGGVASLHAETNQMQRNTKLAVRCQNKLWELEGTLREVMGSIEEVCRVAFEKTTRRADDIATHAKNMCRKLQCLITEKDEKIEALQSERDEVRTQLHTTEDECQMRAEATTQEIKKLHLFIVFYLRSQWRETVTRAVETWNQHAQKGKIEKLQRHVEELRFKLSLRQCPDALHTPEDDKTTTKTVLGNVETALENILDYTFNGFEEPGDIEKIAQKNMQQWAAIEDLKAEAEESDLETRYKTLKAEIKELKDTVKKYQIQTQLTTAETLAKTHLGCLKKQLEELKHKNERLMEENEQLEELKHKNEHLMEENEHLVFGEQNMARMVKTLQCKLDATSSAPLADVHQGNNAFGQHSNDDPKRDEPSVRISVYNEVPEVRIECSSLEAKNRKSKAEIKALEDTVKHEIQTQPKTTSTLAKTEDNGHMDQKETFANVMWNTKRLRQFARLAFYAAVLTAMYRYKTQLCVTAELFWLAAVILVMFGCELIRLAFNTMWIIVWELVQIKWCLQGISPSEEC